MSAEPTRSDERRDPRAAFFLVVAAICAVLIVPTPADLRWVPITLVAVYSTLAGLVLLDVLSKNRR
jgi:hypothetical protein